MQRHLLGLIAICFLAVGLSIFFVNSAMSVATGMMGSCIKIGCVLAALWLAMPQVDQFFGNTPLWKFGLGIAAVAIVAFQPWLLIYVAIAAAAFYLLSGRVLPKLGINNLGSLATPAKRRARQPEKTLPKE